MNKSSPNHVGKKRRAPGRGAFCGVSLLNMNEGGAADR